MCLLSFRTVGLPQFDGANFFMGRWYKYEQLVGQKIGLLTIIKISGADSKGRKRFFCLCECGATTDVAAYSVASGYTKSCGHLAFIGTHTTHGMSKSPEYRGEYQAWCGMRDRVNNVNGQNYRDYGGRGIRIDERWNSFNNFLNDVGRRPSKKHSLDRINVNGNYEPSNCRWATVSEQARNKRNTVRVEYMGRVMILQEWANELGVKSSTMSRIIRDNRNYKVL